MMETPKESDKLFAVYLNSPMLYDKLQMLSAEYSLSPEALVNISVERLVTDIEFVRELRLGRIKGV